MTAAASLARTYLFVPGNRPERFPKALASGADALILDLEDSVPAPEKPAARNAINQWLSTTTPDRPIWIRINPLTTQAYQDDLQLLCDVQPAGVLLPKCEGAADIHTLDEALNLIEQSAGKTSGALSVIAIATETARAVQLIRSFTRPLPRLAGILWGAEDLASALGLRSLRARDGQYLSAALHARDAALFASHACGVSAIDAVFTGLEDEAGLTAETRQHAALGFTAKAAIHPNQIPVIHHALEPSEDDLGWAKEVISELADGTRSSGRVRGSMVDQPHLEAARRILRVRSN